MRNMEPVLSPEPTVLVINSIVMGPQKAKNRFRFLRSLYRCTPSEKGKVALALTHYVDAPTTSECLTYLPWQPELKQGKAWKSVCVILNVVTVNICHFHSWQLGLTLSVKDCHFNTTVGLICDFLNDCRAKALRCCEN